DPGARVSVAVQQVALRFTALDVGRNSAGNLLPIVADVDDVVAALAPRLAAADVHGRHAEIRALTDRDARIADNRGRPAQQPQEVFGEHVPEEMKVLRIFLLAKHADSFGDAVGSRVDVWPEPEDRKTEVLHRIERLVDLLP